MVTVYRDAEDGEGGEGRKSCPVITKSLKYRILKCWYPILATPRDGHPCRSPAVLFLYFHSLDLR